MGSCVSVHKDPDSVTKLRFAIGSKNEKLLIPSPVKEKPDTVNVKSQSFVDAGSKDEAFFDSQPWLESDCEDDFFSVNGDSTPSRGSSPVHRNFTVKNLLVDEEGPVDSFTEPSSPNKKKRLSELFKESLGGNEDALKSSSGTPYVSRASSMGSIERTPNGMLKEEEKSLRSPHCCLPRLLSSRSLGERKKKTSPGQNHG